MRADATAQPRGNPPDQAPAHGLRFMVGDVETGPRTSPLWNVPGLGDVKTDIAAYPWDPIILAALIGANGTQTITIDSAADFEWLMLHLGEASPVTVAITLVGGPFSGIEITNAAIDSRLIAGIGIRPAYLPVGAIIPGQSSLRITLTNLVAVAQTIRPVAIGRHVFMPHGTSLAAGVAARVPQFLEYSYLPLLASAVDTVARIPPDTTGDFEWHFHNQVRAAVDGGADAPQRTRVNFRDRGQQRNILFNASVEDSLVSGTGERPFYLPTRRVIEAGDTFEVLATDNLAPAAPAATNIRGVLAGIRHLGGAYFDQET